MGVKSHSFYSLQTDIFHLYQHGEGSQGPDSQNKCQRFTPTEQQSLMFLAECSTEISNILCKHPSPAYEMVAKCTAWLNVETLSIWVQKKCKCNFTWIIKVISVWQIRVGSQQDI